MGWGQYGDEKELSFSQRLGQAIQAASRNFGANTKDYAVSRGMIDKPEERAIAQEEMERLLAESNGADAGWDEKIPNERAVLAPLSPGEDDGWGGVVPHERDLLAMNTPEGTVPDSDEQLSTNIDGRNQKALDILNNSDPIDVASDPRKVAKKHLIAKSQEPTQGAMEDALRLKAQTELLAGLGQAGGKVGAAIGRTKADSSFWDKMHKGAGYQADNERKSQEAKLKRDALKEQKQLRIDAKQSETDRKELAKYGLARQGIGRGTAKVVGKLNVKQRGIRTIQSDLAAYRSGARVLTPEQRMDLSTRISAILTEGAPPLSLIENTQFNTLKTKMAVLGQKVTNMPMNAYSDELLDEVQKQMDDLEGANKMYWQELQADLYNTQAKELGHRNPERIANHMPELTKHLHFDDDMNAIPLYQKEMKDGKNRKQEGSKVTQEAASADSAMVRRAEEAAAKGDQGAIDFLDRRRSGVAKR